LQTNIGFAIFDVWKENAWNVENLWWVESTRSFVQINAGLLTTIDKMQIQPIICAM
jgi:hypothetical protein